MLYAVLMSRICKRFAEGGRPYTAIELRNETNIPIRFINDLLYRLIEARLVIEITTDEKGDTSKFMPAEDIKNLSVGVMIDRLESQGTWKIDLDISSLSNTSWGKALECRSTYLSGLREIPLQDL
jgi:membrane protein